MYRYNRYTCLYLVPKDEYEYLKSDCESGRNEDVETFSSNDRANNDGGKDIHQVNNIRVTKGANVIIRGERDRISGTAPSYNYGEEEEGEEGGRGINEGDVSYEEWKRRREGEEEEREEEGEKKEERAKRARKKSKKGRKSLPVIGENVRFPLVREEAQIHSELPLQMKRGDVEPRWIATPNQGRAAETNSTRYYYNNRPPPTDERGSSYSYRSSAPSTLNSTFDNEQQRGSEGDVTMRTVSSYPPSSRSPSSKISSTRSARMARRTSMSSLSAPPSSRGRRRTSSSSSSSTAPSSSTSSKVSLKPPSLVLPLPDKDEPMPLAASGASSAPVSRRIASRSNRDYLRQIIADRLVTLQGKKRKPASSTASSQRSASFRPPPAKKVSPKREFPLGKRRNPFQERTPRKKKVLPVINEEMAEDE